MVQVVRDGKKVSPTCPECGCRLELADDGMLQHFYTPNIDGSISRDARGCKCSLLATFWILDKWGKLIGGRTSYAV